MDAFFASVELLHHPEWRGRPLVVGSGPHERGVVSTCSYEARRYGIRSAMPSRTAYQLCPHAIFTPPNLRLYRTVSDQAFEIFSHYAPSVERVSIDEAFLDITGTVHLYGSPAALGEALRGEIRRVCGVTCSVGIAPNRLLAKIASEENKPDGLTLMPVEPDAIAAWLAPRRVDILWGVGKKTADALKPYGITTCGDIQRLDDERLATILGSRAAAASLRAYAFGIASAHVAREDADEKSVSRENTFSVDVSARDTVRRELLTLVEEVGRRFRRDTRWAATARIKLRDAAFTTLTRQAPFARPVRDDIAFREKAIDLFDALWPAHEKERTGTRAVRLIGFGVTNISRTPDVGGQPALFADAADSARLRRERLSDALDALRARGLMRTRPDDPQEN
jgi:DNA polymerase-4